MESSVHGKKFNIIWPKTANKKRIIHKANYGVSFQSTNQLRKAMPVQ